MRDAGTLRAVLGWALAAAVLAGLVVQFGQPAGAQDAPDGERYGLGEELFTRHCAACHAIVADPDAPAPDLRETTIAYADLVLRTGRMPPGDPAGQTKGPIRYSEAEQAALLTYLTAHFDLEGEVAAPRPGDPAQGREVFATHCAACHGSTGAGGVAGGGAITPNVIGLEPLTLAQAIRVGPFQMPRFSPDQISDAELGDVAAFMEEVADEPRTLLGLAELNPVFASAYVFVLSVIVLLSCLWISGRVQMFPDRPRDADDQPETQS